LKENKTIQDLISVIVPVYNAERYLNRCIDSILAQTYPFFEIIAINDGSQDNSQSILEGYASNYPETVRIFFQNNQGIALTRNRGIELARGKYLMFIDNDDFLDPDFMETYIVEFANHQYDMVVGGFRRPNATGKIVRTEKLDSRKISLLSYLVAWNKVYKRDFLIENNIRFLPLNIGEDLYFSVLAAFLANSVGDVDYVGYNYVLNHSSFSNTSQKDITCLDILPLYNTCYDTFKEKGFIAKEPELMESMFTEWVSWVLSFASKGLSLKTISIKYDELFLWLKERFPYYRKNKYLNLFNPLAHSTGKRTILSFFLLLHRIHLGKLTVFLWSRLT
jgi:glycosyltransferase involved in cell wall biosynthesis